MPRFDMTAGPGRPRGSKSKKPFSAQEFANRIDELDFDILEEYVKLYRHPETAPKTKADILKELMCYAFPKRRSVETSGSVRHENLNISWNVGDEIQKAESLSPPTVDATVSYEGITINEPSYQSDDDD